MSDEGQPDTRTPQVFRYEGKDYVSMDEYLRLNKRYRDFYTRDWISVEERLPESGETVLVWHHGEVQMAWLNHFTNGVAYFVRDTHYNFEPTHWMPLPSPPGGSR